jgi:hypothetical protein
MHSSNSNLNLGLNNPLYNKNVQQTTSNVTVPKQQPYQYTYHSFNNMQNNGSNGIAAFSQQQSQFNNQNKFLASSNNNGNMQTAGNGYQYHYSYANQANMNNNFNNLGNNNQGYNYGGYGYTENNNLNSQSHVNHDEQLLEDLPGDDNIQRLF